MLALLVLQSIPLAALADDEWTFRLSPYLWFAGLEGELTTVPGAPPAPVDVSAGDALRDTEIGLMLFFDARRGRHGIFADVIYTDVRSDEELVPPPIDLRLSSVSKTLLVSLAYEYGLYQQGDTAADLLLGARYWGIDSELRFAGGAGLLGGRRIRNDESWIDPFVGVKGRLPLGESRFFLTGGGGVGGFGFGSELFYEFNANLGYQWNRAIGTTLGYRLFDVDYDDGFLYDVRQQGWQLGLSWSF